MEQLRCVEEVTIDSAEEFLEYLTLTNSRWKPEHRLWNEEYNSPWIFRGHNDASWNLHPHAWRATGLKILAPIIERLRPKIDIVWDDIRLRIGSKFSSQKKVTAINLVQIATEHEVVNQFAEMADNLGYPVPDSKNLISGINFLANPTAYDWPSFKINTTMCLAQHHGIPTRLMDWTYNPLFAAFFAADGTKIDTKRFAVWALNLHLINNEERGGLKAYRFRTMTC